MEIYNIGPTAQDLTGWKIRYYNNGSISVTATINLKGLLNAGSYLIAAKDSTAFKNVYGFYPDYDQGAFYFNGDKDGVELFNGTSVVDRFNNTGGIMTSWTDNHRFERKNYPNSGTNLSTDWEDKGTGNGSPKAPNDISLSVMMSTFDASRVNEGVRIQWTTESEVNALGFIVLRSTDRDGRYERIGRIEGRGNTSSQSVYEFSDTHAEKGTLYWYKLEEWSDQGRGETWGPIMVSSSPMVAVTPESFKLVGNFPNPFNPGTTIRYQVPDGIHRSIRLTIVNIVGESVVTLVDREIAPGDHTVNWDGRDGSGREAPNGVYLAVLSDDNRPMSMLRLIKVK
jgi:hypothetical protein